MYRWFIQMLRVRAGRCGLLLEVREGIFTGSRPRRIRSGFHTCTLGKVQTIGPGRCAVVSLCFTYEERNMRFSESDWRVQVRGGAWGRASRRRDITFRVCCGDHLLLFTPHWHWRRHPIKPKALETITVFPRWHLFRKSMTWMTPFFIFSILHLSHERNIASVFTGGLAGKEMPLTLLPDNNGKWNFVMAKFIL